jgi:hypothetical protein
MLNGVRGQLRSHETEIGHERGRALGGMRTDEAARQGTALGTAAKTCSAVMVGLSLTGDILKISARPVISMSR